jgi:DNA polymerase III epsilon subunit-like protein
VVVLFLAQYRRQAPTMDRPLIVLDTETATLGSPPHLLELGAVRVIDGEIEDTFESLVCPAVPIDPGAQMIHGITEEDVRNERWANQVLEEFTEWAGEDWFAAHNAGFDARVLGFEYHRAGLTPPPGFFIDSLDMAKQHIPESPDHKLETLCQVLDLEEGEHHRALADAVWCWKVVEECLERAGGLDQAKLTDHLAGRGRPMTVASRGPSEPRLSQRLRPLQRAAGEGALVTLLYGDGSGSPVPLKVLPKLLYDHKGVGYLEGECQRSGLLKTYRLDRVRKVK